MLVKFYLKFIYIYALITQHADNPADIANVFNRYFFSVFNTAQCHDSHRHLDQENYNTIDTLQDIVITPKEVYECLCTLDQNKASGPDRIPATLLRHCASSICSSLSELFNKTLSVGKLPKEWKLSNITPIPKSGSSSNVTNYRPISLLSLVSKVLERCIYNRLIEHIGEKLHHLQFGFLKGKSTTSQLLQVLHDIGNKLDNKCQVDTLYLDFAKAFDKVNHELLLLKLKRFGISGNLLSWLRDYLSGRYQRVTVLGETSNPLPVLSGVPQGSILGPLLFLVYVNDLPDCISSSSSLAMFADDSKCYHPIQCSEDAEVLQCDINAIDSWCKEWQMSLNHSKCGLLRITRNSQPIHYSYNVEGNLLKTINKQKDLGVIVSKDLKWSLNVQAVSNKANKMLGFVKRSCFHASDPKVRKTLYLALVRSQLGYCSQVWAPQTTHDIQTLERVQRRSTKFILSLPFQTDISYPKRLAKLNILPITYWHEYMDLVYLFKCIYENSDKNVKLHSPNRVTRRSSSTSGLLLQITKSKTVTFQNSFYIRACRTWNTLPISLRNLTLLSSFKRCLFNYYFLLTSNVYNPELPHTYKTVCVKCHKARPLDSLSDTLCC